jgi:hypothetical protein
MTTYTPRPHGEYLEWIDSKIAFADKGIAEGFVKAFSDYRASLLANRAGLERHKWQLVREQLFPELSARIVCSSCESWQFGKLSVPFPCDPYTDIIKHLDEVM